MRRTKLAKLTRPRLHKAVARERLFHLLDEKREHPVVWIVGPPGAGKTTLAASYLEEAGVPAIWYQIDPGDSDPATFFFYLKQAIEAVAKRKAKPLPLLTPEYLPDLPGFARRFVRGGFARLPDEAILVFDNYHDIAADSALHAPFVAALAEVPQGSNIIVLSRVAPPAGFAGALVNQTISLVSWEDLRLTAEETTAIAASRGITDRNLLRTLHEQSTGWTAGVTLMLESLRHGGSLESLQEAGAFDTVFDYFAGLIFDYASEETREVLMKTAFLPRVSATLAEKVTGKTNAIEHIEDLHRRHIFTDRSVGGAVSYQYHALLRAFLKSRAALAYTIDERRAIARLAASSLAAGGQTENAFVLYAEAEDWDNAEGLLIESAANLIGQGRWQTLGRWVDALPQYRRDANPWVRYWLGRSKIYVDPLGARSPIEAAYVSFCSSANEVGQLLAAAAMLEAIYVHYRQFNLMGPWIDRVVTGLENAVTLPTEEDELWVHSMLLMGASYENPEHPMSGKSFSRVEQLLSHPFDPNLTVSVATVLHSYGYSNMDIDAEHLATRTARPLLACAGLTAGRAAFYLTHEGYAHYVHGRYAQALACFDESDTIAFQHGLGNVVLTTAVWRAVTQRRAGMLSEAEETIRYAESLPEAKTLPFAPIEFVKAGIEYDRGNYGKIVSRVLQAQSLCEASGSYLSKMLVGLVSTNVLIGSGKLDLAADFLTRVRRNVLGPVSEHYLGAIALNDAWLAHRRGDFERRNELLHEALMLSNDLRARERFRWYPNAMSELLPVALDLGIETGMALTLAREFSVVPEPTDIKHWPWPIKIYTLGHFELLIDGECPGYSRKAPKKVLALLKAIIAHGGKDVPEQRLIDALWPDEEGDAARRALTATLHRLRKLLGNGKAIRQTGGELTLNEQVCWIDARTFERQIESAERDLDGFNNALGLYRGAFLAQEDGAPWVIAPRERLRSKFIHAIENLGSSLERAGRHETAIDLYIRGVEADPLVEPFYQGLMRCYEHLDRRSEAAGAYRRLRQTLSVTLGVQPSTESQRLFSTLR